LPIDKVVGDQRLQMPTNRNLRHAGSGRKVGHRRVTVMQQRHDLGARLAQEIDERGVWRSSHKNYSTDSLNNCRASHVIP
jgi:hypothetical protein